MPDSEFRQEVGEHFWRLGEGVGAIPAGFRARALLPSIMERHHSTEKQIATIHQWIIGLCSQAVLDGDIYKCNQLHFQFFLINRFK
ncbi:hypothetical protein CEXT_750381 [Caerostris extrusa]|uniref:Uncharacterized protein n=1 Tax=Caerostris extrusa TaxID=172846 RepID=A0AAV4TLQ9_CAEEX|nr:hypothetical protein CEXT_750381 [Caerostris extrusa]